MFSKYNPEPSHEPFRFACYIVIFFYIITALRGSGTITNKTNDKLSKQAMRDRPYLESHSTQCTYCNMVKAYRSKHCFICKQCVPKYTKHSLIFNQCIGAAN